MKSHLISNLFLLIFVIFVLNKTDAQFWKLNNLTERDIFILETKASMASGICYKAVTGNSNDPELRIHTHSYCCDGYFQNSNAMGIQCDPICNEDCANGICTAPDTCECFPGYSRSGGRCEEL